MKIYTRSGDKGETSLANGQRISKASPVIDFLGSLDELNSLIGICVSYLDVGIKKDFTEEIEVLEAIQSDLFTVGAIAAGSNISFNSKKEVENIEKTIDEYENLLSKLRNFILPGGSLQSAYLHNARSLVRKLERDLVALNSPSVMEFSPYLNRLSDLLFVMARFVNFKLGIQETIWKGS